MKKLLLTACAMSLVASAFAQGTVVFSTRSSGVTSVLVRYNANVFTQVRGQGASDLPAGTTDWSGYAALTGSGYSAVLRSAPSGTIADDSTAWASAVASFRTGTSAGAVAGGLTVTLANVAKDSASASLEIFAWDNKGGTLTDPTAAWTAWRAGNTSGGTSGTFSLASIGGDFNIPPNVFAAAGNATSPLVSFNIYTIPEPSTMALAGLGAAALLIFRRRK